MAENGFLVIERLSERDVDGLHDDTSEDLAPSSTLGVEARGVSFYVSAGLFGMGDSLTGTTGSLSRWSGIGIL